MKKVIAEAGNSFFKIKYNNRVFFAKYQDIEKLLSKFNIKELLICNTAQKDFSKYTFLYSEFNKYYIKPQLKYNYDFSELGIDRILASEFIFSNFSSNFILFSFGSALTVNIIKNSVFEQGYIVSSKYKNYKSLMELGNLKSLTGDYKIKKTNKSLNTKQAVINGILKMENAFIKEIITENNEFDIFLTGGDKNIPFNLFKSFYYSDNFVLNAMEVFNDKKT
ncbi:MAG: type III pantothenate kinase [Candidatus Muirbacterium halophilum]|nr:type III pantothenate kinase [Candidatus Muirbacterium halophilum]